MDIDVQCTICGSSEASRCARCRSAAYCSLECQQTDWRTHRLLCTKFSEQAQDNYASRPSPTHYLAIFFPMDKKRPSIVWIDTKKDKYEVEPYFHPVLDQLLHIPGNDGYIGRGLRQVQGNVLRGRTSWQNTLNIWFLDPDVTPRNITTNQAIHGTIPTLIGDTWGEFIWKGPVVAVMRKGTGYEPRHSTDITLTAYRDAVDYLGYYRDTIGSMIEPGREDHLSKRVLADRISKVVGVRINCLRDQISRQEPQLVEVAVPKTHPLFNLEGDDPCDIPALFGVDLVAKSYSNNQSNNDETPPADDLQNPLAQLLLMTTSVKGGEWVHSPDYRRHLHQGSILFVCRSKRDIKTDDIHRFCNLIEEIAVPFILKEDASSPGAKKRLLSRLEEEGTRRGMKYRGEMY
ncbi:Ubiquitin carboxyl-terminal hydrolase 19 [Fusarium oxysporum f. sp. raphani]|uniref:Ubiquitin carboxyl-terminal hydrolase 19 n=1 Tax=Fusarium oxysporum f. sp. raphani TaxID=96318 RepID=A0A8J5ND99_FUSOX|nr:Ubiquitin carboxyl-terminal hydrolase 19 [Fusarium oxysporum f. sp. raphani]KAG7402778.1 Ubiquitin carboxyl-terminal hydrolase 19 [Fusarium oxysporum f. sp. raphani]KAG7403125.1 Ubiquitin carboxyl-terminal hydrolase 19 [Fusarium oxysporum f. sp. raphani]KAG7403903.1 Ubiquitin carboxyl-terminal hydrolase 19 [Fusarium oxysporum f. sp. raphani]KAG7404626.1 Ubiquitin carboxyl-terminal hydrolase 19 [Fusarium oxysporum f. sp. raphani]